MENNFDLEYLESLYESLDVSDGAKSRFFEAFLKEAQAEANPNAKKAGLIHKYLAWLNKGTPTVESSAQTILGALAGMERIIQTSPLIANDEARGQRDIQYLAKYKAQIEKATQGIIDAQAKYKEAQDRFFQSNPKVQNAQAQLDQAAEAEIQELEKYDKRMHELYDTGTVQDLQALRDEIEQKQNEVKAQAGNDEDAGDEYGDILEKIENLIQMKSNQNGPEPENQEATAEGEANAEESDPESEGGDHSAQSAAEEDTNKRANELQDKKAKGTITEEEEDELNTLMGESTTPTNIDNKLAE